MVDPAAVVLVDDTSTPITLTPLRARAPRGQRAVGRVPRGKRPHIAWLATLSATGFGERLVVDSPVDGCVFAPFVERVLVPSLRPGQLVVLDNLSVHTSARARQRSEDAGCHLGSPRLPAQLFARLHPSRARLRQDQAGAAPPGGADVGDRRRGQRAPATLRHRGRCPRLLHRCRVLSSMTRLPHAALVASGCAAWLRITPNI
jgi:hypothetical protein